MEEVGYPQQGPGIMQYYILHRRVYTLVWLLKIHYRFRCKDRELGNYDYPNVRYLKERLSMCLNPNLKPCLLCYPMTLLSCQDSSCSGAY